MDHHCPWINNCVGVKNHKYFVLFLFWCISTIGLYCIVQGIRLYQVATSDFTEFPAELIILIVWMSIYIPVLFLIGALFFYQFSLIITGATTVETNEISEAKREAELIGKSYRFQYDLGTQDNLFEFFGTDFTIWVYPFSPKLYGDGVQFRKTSYYGELNDA